RRLSTYIGYCFVSSRRRHTSSKRDWSSDVCSSDLTALAMAKSMRSLRAMPLTITLAQGIARSDRMDFAIAKAVELGVHSIQPLFTECGKVRLDGTRLHKKQAHWQRVAESAAEQSGRLMRPSVAPACALPRLLGSAP